MHQPDIDSPPYEGPERRSKTVFMTTADHYAQCTVTNVATAKELSDMKKTLAEIKELIKSGFPFGDLDAHRRVHESYIEDAEARKKLKAAIIEKTLAGLLWAGLAAVALAVWESMKTSINR